MIHLFRKAFLDLSINMTEADLARLSERVNQAMTASTRVFHNVRHVVGLCKGMKPLQVLAAIFHDVVYYQIDGGLPESFADALANLTRPEGDTLVLQPIDPGDRATTLCAEIFDFLPGQVLILQEGMNEFLSAVVAVRLLRPHLTPAQLVAVSACIEITIPFRGYDPNGQSAVQALAQRLQSVTEKHATELCLGADEIETFVKTIIADAIDLANQDVAGFTKATPVQCLSNTWLLLKEANAPLATAGLQSLLEYRNALLRMSTFLGNLDASHICQSHDGYPEPSAVATMNAVAEQNVRFCRDYLDVEIVFVAVLEALANISGSDCPCILLLGNSTTTTIQIAEQYASLPTPPPEVVCNPELSHLLAQEPLGASINNLTPSPFKHLVYQFVGHDGSEYLAGQARTMFDGALAPRTFLSQLNPALVSAFISACVNTAKAPCRQALTTLQGSFQDQSRGQQHGSGTNSVHLM